MRRIERGRLKTLRIHSKVSWCRKWWVQVADLDSLLEKDAALQTVAAMKTGKSGRYYF